MKLNEIKSALESACQPIARRELAIMASDALTGNAPLPPVILTGFAGLGKSHLAESLLFRGVLEPNGWEICIIPPAASASQLIKALVDFAGEGDVRKVLFWLDEVHSLPAATRNVLKAVTETGGKAKDFNFPLGKENFSVRVDPRRHWFLAASNEAVRDTALVGASGRFMPLQLVPYSESDKGTIFDALLPIYAGKELGHLSPELRAVCLRNCRPFARSIKRLIQELRMERIGGNPMKEPADIGKALARAGYLPGGWRREHIAVLRYVAQAANGRQVQEIAAAPLKGMDPKGASEVLSEMLQGELIVTFANGRKGASQAGVDYVKKLDADLAAAKAAKAAAAKGN